MAITYLSLGREYDKIPPKDLSAAIEHVSLPHLHNVSIGTDSLDPSALRLFLSRHPKLQKVQYQVYREEFAMQSIIDPPLAHPGITDIHVTAFRMGRLITALDGSPNVHTFSFAFWSRLSSAKLAGLLVDLRAISVCTLETTLEFCLFHNRRSPGNDPFWSSGEEICDITTSLHCVRSVELSCFLVADGLSVLPWLALLPLVLNIRFMLHLKHWSEPKLVASGDLPPGVDNVNCPRLRRERPFTQTHGSRVGNRTGQVS
ncbi:hypothetical protein B0H10DRAFT_1957338 [Mycena sp. CBHHK59/15]|nr:hypothetical protein B0H10DRAFT_1957338 [Mycena sp. CBHHK59/15]